MRNIHLDPLWRTSIGFDRLFQLLDESRQVESDGNYPPYNISRTGDETYQISLAIAGFRPENVMVTAHQNTLTIAGRVRSPGAGGCLRDRRRASKREPRLARCCWSAGATFEDGLLEIDLRRRGFRL